jgi:hypothetical protein
MSYGQFMWGLSNGVLVLAMAGAFWLGLAAFNGGFRAGSAILIAVGAIAVAAGSVWLRRKAGGFRFSQLKQGDAAQRLATRRILVGLRWTTLLEMLLVGSAFGICNGIGRQDLVWPAVGAAVSLHFAPMGYLFRLPLYYVTAALGCVVSLIALTQLAPASLWVVGVGMGGILWATAAFAILKSELLANHAAAKESRSTSAGLQL